MSFVMLCEAAMEVKSLSLSLSLSLFFSLSLPFTKHGQGNASEVKSY